MFCIVVILSVFFFKQKTAYEMRISDWSSDVCSSDLRNAQIVDVVLLRRSPHGAQQVGMGEDAAGVLGQLCEYRIFLGRQMHLLPVAADGAAVQVDCQRSDCQRLLRGARTEHDQAVETAVGLERKNRVEGESAQVGGDL